jgi:dTDP-4-dehydrorhamnose 3,5-epimerase-like enzyme
MVCLGKAERFRVFDLECIGDERGTLYVAELTKRGIGPFDRFYFVTGVPDGRKRGGHAHMRQAETIICVQGSVELHVESRGVRDAVALDRPGRAVYVPGGYWRDLLHFSADAVLAVCCSYPFDELDYIRDRAEFVRWEAGAAPAATWSVRRAS